MNIRPVVDTAAASLVKDGVITAVSQEWSSRPPAQRFVSLTGLADKAELDRQRSRSKVISTRRFEVQPFGDDHKGLMITGQNGTPAFMSHYAFGQIAALGKAPARFLRDLPSELAADCLTYALRFIRDAEDVGVLLTADRDDLKDPSVQVMLRAATGPNYGRIWNADIAKALVKHFGDGTREGGGVFQVPGEFRVQVPITPQNTTLYYGDQTMMVYLADETHIVEVPGRRKGSHGALARGFIVWNSEVGDRTFGMAAFDYDYTCMNRRIWGVGEYKQITLRHTVSAPDKWLEQIVPVIESYSNSSTETIQQTIAKAQQAKLDTDLDEFLKKRKFTRSQVVAIKAVHEQEEERPIETLFDLSVGVSAYAKTIVGQEERFDMEREAGSFLEMAV